MKIIGLTGGIASGKNFVAEIFAKNGAAVFDADAEVHEMMKSDVALIREVRKNFSESFIDKKIDRKILSKIVFSDPKKLKILEKIIHPKVRKKYQEFLRDAKKNKKKIAVLNIPLLLETEGYECDKIIAIITPKTLRKKRFIEREKKKHPAAKISELGKKFQFIVAKQLADSERKKQADFILKNDGAANSVASQVKKFLQNEKI